MSRARITTGVVRLAEQEQPVVQPQPEALGDSDLNATTNLFRADRSGAFSVHERFSPDPEAADAEELDIRGRHRLYDDACKDAPGGGVVRSYAAQRAEILDFETDDGRAVPEGDAERWTRTTDRHQPQEHGRIRSRADRVHQDERTKPCAANQFTTHCSWILSLIVLSNADSVLPALG